MKIESEKAKNNIIKEVCIFLLLLILILLILAVALYDFIPANRNIPEAISYSSDSKTTSIKQEIAYTNGGDITADQNDAELVTSLKSYSINSSDLAVYSEKNLYNSGNSNPFDYVNEETANNTPNTADTTNPAPEASTPKEAPTQTTTSTTPGTFTEKPNSK